MDERSPNKFYNITEALNLLNLHYNMDNLALCLQIHCKNKSKNIKIRDDGAHLFLSPIKIISVVSQRSVSNACLENNKNIGGLVIYFTFLKDFCGFLLFNKETNNITSTSFI